jgi:phenylacetic acid degradation operon negative regulatory protein
MKVEMPRIPPDDEPPSGPDALLPQRLVVTMLGTYVRENHPLVWSGGLVRLLSAFGFSGPAARVALSRLAQRDIIARAKQGRFVHYMITELGERMLETADRRMRAFGRQDGDATTWTIIWHNVPEAMRLERVRLGRQLRSLGFGPLQDATWLAPFDHDADIASVIQDLNIEDHVGTFVGRPGATTGIEPLVKRAWDMDALDARYQSFIDTFGAYLPPSAVRELSEDAAFHVHARLVDSFRTFPNTDPGLPAALFRHPGRRALAIQLFDSLDSKLAPMAQRHFDRVCMAWATRRVDPRKPWAVPAEPPAPQVAKPPAPAPPLDVLVPPHANGRRGAAS